MMYGTSRMLESEKSKRNWRAISPTDRAESWSDNLAEVETLCSNVATPPGGPYLSVTFREMVTADPPTGGESASKAGGAVHETFAPVPENVPTVAVQAYCN